MKSVALAVIVLVAVVLAYGLGRRHGSVQVDNAVTAKSEEGSRAALPVTNGVAGEGRASGWTIGVSDREGPFVQNLTAAQRGYEAAQANLDDALAQIESLPVTERVGFITGMMSFVGKHYSPAEALKVHERVSVKDRPAALRGLVAEWISSRSTLNEEVRYLRRESVFATTGSKFGLEVELTTVLAQSEPDGELAKAWMDAFSTKTGRSEMLSMMFNKLPDKSAEAVLNRIEGWTAWEKEKVTRNFLGNWAFQNPQEAWTWYQGEKGRLEGDFAASIFGPWAQNDPEGVKGAIAGIEDSSERQAAISAVGKALAFKNTDDAVAWAEGLGDAKDREAAHRAIYEAAPRGVGAVLAFENGFPLLRAVVPGSPLEGTGVQPGDRFVEVREADGSRHALYGEEFKTVVNRIRGEAGTKMALRVLRENEGGAIEEHLVPVTRGQLYLNEKAVPDRDFIRRVNP